MKELMLTKSEQEFASKFFQKCYGHLYETEPIKKRVIKVRPSATLHKALDIIAKLFEDAAGRCNSRYSWSQWDKAAGIMQLLTGEETPEYIEDILDVCEYMGVEHETFTKNGEDHVVWGAELAERRAKRKRRK